MKRDIELRGASRRDFIKGVVAASAALGLGPTRAYEILDKMGGSALAADAIPACQSVHLVLGTGGFAWSTLLWPVPPMIKTFRTAYAYDDPTKAEMVTGLEGNRDLYVRKIDGQRLWKSYGDKKLVTAMLCGRNTGHEVAPKNTTNSNTIQNGVGGPVQSFAAAAAIETGLKPLVPVIGIQTGGTAMPYGRAPGAPNVASVANATAMIDLFSSAASQVASRLQPTNNQGAFALYYNAFQGLTKTANRPTFQRAYTDARVSLDLLAKNLRTQLQPAANQANTWAGAAQTNEKIVSLAEALIVAANALKLGLTSNVIIPGFNDDPHGAFGGNPGMVADGLGRVLENFMKELSMTPLPGQPGKTLADNIIITVSGDLPKQSYQGPGDWSDGTNGNANWMYVMSNGYMKPGWFGEYLTNGKRNYNPATGALDSVVGNGSGANVTPDQTVTDGALGALLFGIARGDKRKVRDFTTAEFDGMINLSLVV